MLSTDDLLRNWFDLLAAMQSVAKNLNSDTESELGKFAGQNVGDAAALVAALGLPQR